MNWQPIDTAPKVEFDDLIGFDAKIGRYAMQWFEGKWVNSFADVVSPTHWAPLPEPPSDR